MRKRLLASFLCLCLLVGLLPTTALAEGTETEQPTLDISNGSIIITENGYKVGEEEETPWGDNNSNHALTITQSDPDTPIANCIHVLTDAKLTLKGINLNGSMYGESAGVTTGPFFVSGKDVTVDIILEGRNSLTSNSYPGLEVTNGASITIQVPEGKDDTFGSLDALAYGGNNAGIGPRARGAGGKSITINSGTITARGNGMGASIGGNQGYASITNITISGGRVTAQGGNPIGHSQVGNKSEISISGGTVVAPNGFSYKTIAITGGNICDSYSGEIDGRTRVVMTFYDENNQPLNKQKVEVKEDDGTSWFAYTDENGKVITYLADTSNVTAAPKGDKLKKVTFVGDQGVSGGSCICGTSGVLTVNAAPTSTTVYFDAETLTLSADRSCVLPEGFHGDYEDITYEVVSVTVNETPVDTAAISNYASIEGSTLSVKRAADVTAYTVQVQAEYGQEDSKKTSEPIDIQVSVYQSEAQEGELDIGRGTITVTAGSDGKTIYTQGGREVKVAGAEEEVIIMGSSVAGEDISVATNMIDIQGGNPTIVLKNVTITMNAVSNGSAADWCRPAMVLKDDQTATIRLEGVNTLNGGNQAPGVQIDSGAALTIEGKGKLNAASTNNTGGIGSGRSDKYGTPGGGKLIVKGGTISATGQGNSGAIGSSHNEAFGSITIQGGVITTAGSNNSLKANEVTISGGTLLGLHKPISATTTLNITGGNIGDSYSGNITGRTRTQLFFYDAEQNAPRTNAEVTVTENNHTWSALTDENGMITTYLANTTQSVTVDGESVTITAGKGVVDATCTCADHTGAPVITTPTRSLTTINGTATLDLTASYDAGSCVLPDGFHGAYEKISYEITKVVKNGQYMVVDQYAEIEGTTLTVYGETNQDPYTVYVQAKSGPDGEVKSPEIAITVNTYVSGAGENELDISNGSITVTAGSGDDEGKTVYTQNGTAVKTATSGEEVTIMGSSDSNQILVQSGSPTIRLKNVSLTNASASPFLVNGSGTNATVMLEGENTLVSKSGEGISTMSGTVTIKVPDGEDDSYGSLTATGGGDGYPGIGGVNGTVNIKSGTITAVASNGTASGIGPRRRSSMTAINISGGHIINQGNHPLGNTNTCKGSTINISGGYIETGSVGGDAYSGQIELTISGGTIVNSQTPGLVIGDNTTVNITGGNIVNSYLGSIGNRTLTRLYFVEEDGTPKTGMEVSVTEGTDPEANTWTALTDENGVITTYLASDTQSITVSYEGIGEGDSPVDIPESHQALIGGDCSCSADSVIKGITWEPGLPGTVTLYGDQTFAVAAAELVTDTSCAMPIHPNLPGITYSLEVTKGGTTSTENAGDYAVLADGTLTLKQQNAPYTVTLAATAGEKRADCTISVLAGTPAGSQTVIDLSKGDVTISSGENGYTYTQGEDDTGKTASTNILLTGNAANAVVTVNADKIKLGIAQDVTGNVWSIRAGEDVTDISIDIETLAGKVRFGNTDDQQYLMGYVSGEKVKLNPDAGDITLGDGSAAQGAFTVTGLGNCSAVIGGADTEADRLVENNGTDALSVEINGETVALTAGDSHTIKKANKSSIKADGTVASYLLNGTTLLNEFDFGDPTYSYMTAEKFRELIGNAEVVGTVTGYRLAVVGEGSTAGLHGYRDNGTVDQQKIAELYLDADLTEIISDTTAAYENDFLFYTNIRSLSLDHAKSVGLYSCFFESIHLGPQVESLASSNYLRGLQEITVDEENEYYQTVDGVLYTKDGTTLILCPAGKTGNYKILDTCTAIADVSFSGSHLSELTFGNQLSSLGSRWMENARFTAVHVPTSNPYFKSEDGVLYSLDGATLLYYPVYKTDSEFSIPEGVTTIANMGIYSQYRLKKLTLPSTLSSVGAYVFRGSPLEELDIKTTTLASASINSAVLSKVTVPDGYNFQNKLLTSTPMAWTQGITVSGGGNISYDGESHSISVLCQNDANVDIQYSLDGEEWSDSVTCVEPGEYTVYWKATKPADYVEATEDTPASGYAFDRVLYSSRTFTITALEADESWFTLTAVKPDDADEDFIPVTLNQPAAAPSLEGGYTVKYSKDGTETATETAPTEAGSCLVTVEITKEGYVQEALTLGYYTILSDGQSGSNVLSFVTNGGTTIKPIIKAASTEISEEEVPTNPTRTGYTFEGWYEDAALRTKVESFPATMPSESVTYYAKWVRKNYSITYNGMDGATHNNPVSYHVETPTFTLLAPEKPGYKFIGWTGSNGETAQKEVTIEKGSTDNKTYKANWDIVQYSITYPNAYDQVDGNPDGYTATDTADQTIPLTAPATRKGYTFAGWTMVVDGTSYILPAENAAIPAGTLGDITLTGIWLAENQTLTLNANGGKFSDGKDTMTITAEFDSSLDLSNITPTRSGYKFAGWYTDESCTTPFTGGTMPLTMTIYAKWDRIYTGGSGSSSAVSGSGDNVSVSASGGTVTASQMESAVNKADEGATITIKATSYTTVSLPVGGMAKAAANGNDVLVDLRNGEVTLSAEAIADLTAGMFATSKLEVSITSQTSSEDEAISDLLDKGAAVFDVSVELDGKSVHSFEGDLTISLTVSNLSKISDPHILHILTDGTKEYYAPDSITGSTITVKGIRNLSTFAVIPGSEVPEEQTNPFSDVTTSDYYYDAVLWAVEKGITNGTNAAGTTFSPDVEVSRAQMVTFLWRAHGAPKADGANPFTDVSESDYYYDAVLWAVANGVTKGTSATTFSPDMDVTRAQAVTFQWRAAGASEATGSSFDDVAADAWYTDAVTWAVANEITNGTGGNHFSPDVVVSRAQAVTFLYRELA